MGDQERNFEWRVNWSASSNCTFKGSTGWMPWEGFEDTAEDIQTVADGESKLCVGLETVLEASGFEWSVEVRKAVAE
jgi:hypothetical protein